MTFLSSASEKIYLIMQQNHLKYEKNILNLRYNMTKDQIESIEEEYNELGETAGNPEDDIEYKHLTRYSEQLEAHKESIEASLQALQEQITAEQNLIKDGIKGSCGLSLSGS